MDGDRFTPGWWSVRDRLAARLGPHFWPAFYLAPRSTRDRWANVAALLEIEDADHAVSIARFLEDVGELPPGSADSLADAHACWECDPDPWREREL